MDLYGGGEGAPSIVFLHQCKEEFHCNVTLGQTFWEAITNATFYDRTCKYPLLRLALTLANETTDRKQDGIAKLITKSHIGSVTGKDKAAQARAAENILEDAQKIAKSLIQTKKLHEDAFLRPLSKCFVRVALTISEQGKFGREHKDYTYDEIKACFLADASAVVGTTVTYSSWGVDEHEVADAVQASAPVVQEATAEDGLISTSDHADPEWIAKRSGFSVGAIITEKGSGVSLNTVMKITSISRTIAIESAFPYDGNKFSGTMSLEDLLKSWSVSKQELPFVMNGAQRRNPALNIDKQKCRMYIALMDADRDNASLQSLRFWRKPDEVRTTIKVSKDSLVLVPIAPLVNVSVKDTPGSIKLELDDADIDDRTFHISSMARPPVNKDTPEEFPEACNVAPFWWVSPVPTEKEANMKFGTIVKGGVKIPVLKNKTDLQPFVRLTMQVQGCSRSRQNAAQERQCHVRCQAGPKVKSSCL